MLQQPASLVLILFIAIALRFLRFQVCTGN